MNPLETSSQGDLRDALISGEFKRLVKHDSFMGEVEKKHIVASADHVLKLAEQSMQSALYDLPPLPPDMYVMSIVNVMFGNVYSYIFASEEDAVSSARWYATYAGWDKEREKMLVQTGEDFVLRLVDGKSGDWIIVGKSRVNFTSLSPATSTA